MKEEGERVRGFVTGASGAIGSRLVPQLIDAGHEVVGSHNWPASAELLRTLGAKPVMLDLLDARAVRKAVLENEPIVHEATALRCAAGSRARSRGAPIRAQSVAAFNRYAREGGPVKTEDDPIEQHRPTRTSPPPR
jgi:nucleoside-diphosphate-sugar epimerase